MSSTSVTLLGRVAQSYLIYLGAVHELPCQAYVLHAAGTQQGLNKDLQQAGGTGDNVQEETAFN